MIINTIILHYSSYSQVVQEGRVDRAAGREGEGDRNMVQENYTCSHAIYNVQFVLKN